ITRFERRIVMAIVVVAVAPLLGSWIMGRRFLREVYHVGVRSSVRAELERGLAARRAHFVALRKNAECTADNITHDTRPWTAMASAGPQEEIASYLDEVLSKHPNVTQVSIVSSAHGVLGQVANTQVAPTKVRLVTEYRKVHREDDTLVVATTIAAPASPFR